MAPRVLKAALVAGFLAAVVTTALQFFATAPLILEAETFEIRASIASPHGTLVQAHDHAPEATQPQEAETGDWEPAAGLSRAAFTGLATLVSAVGYALVLAALLLAAGSELSIARTLAGAIGGFLAVNLAPASGLPPELPGVGGADLTARQGWWLMTVAGTGAGLYLVGVIRSGWAVAAGVGAIALPHVIGAPHHAAASSDVPAALAALFAARSLAVGFVFWVVLGLSLGWAWRRLATRAEAIAA